MTGMTDLETDEATSIMAKDQEVPKRRGIDLPMFNEDTGNTCPPAWDNSPIFFISVSFVALVVLASWSTIAIGILYFLMGALFHKHIREKNSKKVSQTTMSNEGRVVVGGEDSVCNSEGGNRSHCDSE